MKLATIFITRVSIAEGLQGQRSKVKVMSDNGGGIHFHGVASRLACLRLSGCGGEGKRLGNAQGSANVWIATSVPADSSHRAVASTLYDLIVLQKYEHYSPEAGTRRLVTAAFRAPYKCTYLLTAAQLG